jgi:hypothetical protein
MLLVGDAVVGGSSALLLELLADGLAVELLFEDGLWVDGFELGLEVFQVVRRGVAAAAGVERVGLDVLELVADGAPVGMVRSMYILMLKVLNWEE